MSLGSDIVVALNALSEADKRDMVKVWDAIGNEIEDYPQSSIFDNRAAGDVTPDDLPEKTIYFTFTDDITGSPNTWDAVLNVKGWSDGYTAWQLFSNSDAVDADKNLYFRRGRNAAWDTLQKIWTDQNDGVGSGLDADKLDTFHAASFIRSDADDDVFGHTEWQDHKEIRLGNDADFRIYHSGAAAYLKSYLHGAPIYIQGENASGVNKAILYMDPDGYVKLYYAGSIRFETVSDGAKITGKLELTSAGSKFYSPVSGEDSLGTGHWRGNSAGNTPIVDQNLAVVSTWYTATFSNAPNGAKGAWGFVLLTRGTLGGSDVFIRKYGDTQGFNSVIRQTISANTTYNGCLCWFPLDSSKRAQVGTIYASNRLRVYEVIFYDI